MIRARIQHHPSRAHLLPELRRRLRGLRPQVIEHASDPPSPWDGYKGCLENIPVCSHLLVIQDDAVPVPGFVEALPAIAERWPETPVCLFLARLPRDASARADQAKRRGQRYVPISVRSFLPIVAVLWPRDKAIEFAEWAEENPRLPGQIAPRSDDAMGGRWKMLTRQAVVATVPSLVEHPDIEPSTIGKQPQWGKNRARTAHLIAEDATVFDWSGP